MVMAAKAVRVSRMTGNPVSSPILLICWFRPSRKMSSNQVCPASRLVTITSVGSVIPSSSFTPSRHFATSSADMSPCTFTR